MIPSQFSHPLESPLGGFLSTSHSLSEVPIMDTKPKITPPQDSLY